MKTLSDISTGLQHVALFTSKYEETIRFYEKLGFEVIAPTVVVSSDTRICFLQFRDCQIELVGVTSAPDCEGSWAHLCLNTNDVEEAWTWCRERGYTILDTEIQQLPLLDRGVRYFMIAGLNGEKIEFNQVL